ncbi:MAG: ribokinase [Actinobacteria bacterium 13_2_20CM_2_71_6]|nr:MAG: ribokinase [Actinobacteria bacterium 13_2_20CM_2_71_6]
MRVVVVGSANMDLVATAPTLPRPGETVLGNDFTQVPGGKGANQAIAAVRAGAPVRFIGAIGSDAFGVTLRARLSASTVDTSLLRVVYGASGVALVLVDGTGENAIVVAPGANAALTTLTDADRAAIAEADVLLLQLEIPLDTVTAAARVAREAGTRVVLNAAPARPLPPGLTEAVDLLVVNQVEAAALAPVAPVGVDAVPEPDDADPWALVDALLADVPRVVLTRGAGGAWYGARDSEPVHVPAPVVTAVDTTAAGDAFTAALAVGWGEGRSLVDAVRWASAAGAAAARRLGASSALPSRTDIDELYVLTYPG